MKTTSRPQVHGRTNWKLFAAAFVPAVGVASGLLAGMAHGAVPSTFVVSGAEAKVTAASLHGTGFAQYGTVLEKPGDPRDPKTALLPAARAAMKSATLVDMCQSVVIEIPFLGDYTLWIRAGQEPGNPVKATNMYIDMNQLSGNAEFKNIDIGIDASVLNNKKQGGGKGPSGAVGMQGLFSQQADEITIRGLQQTMYATQAESFTLNGLSLDLKKGKDECRLSRS